VDYVRSGDTAVRRSASLHSRPNHLMGHSTGSVSQAFRSAPCSRKLQECVSGFANAQAQTVEGGCRGKCLPPSDGSTIPVSLSEHSVPCSHFPRNRGPSYRARTGATSTPGAEPLDLHLLEDAGHMVTYADVSAIAKAADTAGVAISS